MVAIPEPSHQTLHAFPQEFVVDHQDHVWDPVGMQGVTLEAEINVLSASSNAILKINTCLRRAQLDPELLFIQSVASSLAVLAEEEMKGGVALIDIGGGTTDIAIFQDNILRFSSTLPFGGNIITADIATGCSIMDKQAEQLKIRFGHSIPEETKPNEYVAIEGVRQRAPKEISTRNLSRIISARMEEIIELVDNEILSSGWSNKLNMGLVITGGGAHMKGIKSLFELMTGRECRIGHPNEHVSKTKTEQLVKDPAYATAIGLVLAGYRSPDPRVSSPVLCNKSSDTGTNQAQKKTAGSKEPSFFKKVTGIFFEGLDTNQTY
jgi:cell division protein FtsA